MMDLGWTIKSLLIRRNTLSNLQNMLNKYFEPHRELVRWCNDIFWKHCSFLLLETHQLGAQPTQNPVSMWERTSGHLDADYYEHRNDPETRKMNISAMLLEEVAYHGLTKLLLLIATFSIWSIWNTFTCVSLPDSLSNHNRRHKAARVLQQS